LLKLGEYEKLAKMSEDFEVREDVDHVVMWKYAIRCAEACIHLKQYSSAHKLLSTAIATLPENKYGVILLNKVINLQRMENVHMEQVYRNMFKGISNDEEKSGNIVSRLPRHIKIALLAFAFALVGVALKMFLS